MSDYKIGNSEFDLQSFACCFPIKTTRNTGQMTAQQKATSAPSRIQIIEVVAVLLLSGAVLGGITRIVLAEQWALDGSASQSTHK